MRKETSVFRIVIFFTGISWIMMLGVAFISCSEDGDNNTMEAPDPVVSKALSLFAGTVTESELENEDGVAAWKVEITTQQGSQVEVYYRQDNNDLLRLDGEQGPYDYNISPGNGLIDFNQAKTIAAGQTSEALDSWRLRTEDKYNDRWVYTLEHASTKIFIDALDGTVLDLES